MASPPTRARDHTAYGVWSPLGIDCSIESAIGSKTEPADAGRQGDDAMTGHGIALEDSGRDGNWPCLRMGAHDVGIDRGIWFSQASTGDVIDRRRSSTLFRFFFPVRRTDSRSSVSAGVGGKRRRNLVATSPVASTAGTQSPRAPPLHRSLDLSLAESFSSILFFNGSCVVSFCQISRVSYLFAYHPMLPN